MVATAVDEARAVNSITMLGALTQGACPVALMTGDLMALERRVNVLFDYAKRYALQLFRDLGRCFQALLLVKRAGTTSMLSAQLVDFHKAVAVVDLMYHAMFLGQMVHPLCCVVGRRKVSRRWNRQSTEPPALKSAGCLESCCA